VNRRSLVRAVLVPAAIGLLSVSVAWAGAGLVPVGIDADDAPVEVEDTSVGVEVVDGVAAPALGATATASFPAPGEVALPTGALDEGWYHVGAAKVDLYPRPDDYDDQFPGARWERDKAACETLDEDGLDHIVPGVGNEHDHEAVAGSPWPENPDCLYMGGFGLGPVNPIVEFDADGLWVRTVAISSGRDDDGDGATDTLMLTVIDAEGWLWDYAEKCDDCGWKQIQARLAAELGVSESSFVSHATHSHAAMDYLGGWGFVPDWYMQQSVDSIEASVRSAIAAMQPARLEVGEVLARPYNRERRDTYRAAEDPTISYLRAFVPETATTEPGKGQGKGGAPNQQPPEVTIPARTLATIGVYAAHPTTMGTNGGTAHPDWPGLFAKQAEERFGGMAMHMMSGLGNMSASGGTAIGTHLANTLPALGAGRLVEATSIATTERRWAQPATNVPLSALGVAGFFDRKFLSEPATIAVGESANSPCVSASPFSVEVVARAANIGGALAVTSGPGEMFANSTNTIEEQMSRLYGVFALAVAQSNDSLGYLPESFEQSTNPAAGQGGGFVGGGELYINYEDAYAIDRCFGDANLEYTLELLDQVF